MKDSIRNILVLIERQENGGIHPLSLEALGAALKLARSTGARLQAGLAEADGTAAEELRHYPVDRVYAVVHPLLKTYPPEAFETACLKIVEQAAPDLIFGAHTLAAIDLFPRLADSLDAGLAMDCTRIDLSDAGIEIHKPVYSGNVMAVYTPASLPCLVTVRARTAEPPARTETASGDIVSVDAELDERLFNIKLLNRVRDEDAGGKLADADIVVAGGRGMGGPEGFARLSELAGLLGGAMGASRPPCDLDWAPAKTQVGLTGEIVAPSLYIAVGISGSFQHLAGMADSKTIVAINRDERANIFKVAHYGVVGDYEEVLPAFQKELKRLLNG